MKKTLLLLFAAFVTLVTMPAKAQVESMTDLFGKYKFTATIETTEAGKAHADLWKSECEVIITKGTNGNVGTVKGLLGEGANQTIAKFDATNKKFEVVNPNPNYGLLSQNPYIGVTDMTLEDLQMYTMEYHYNPETKEITIPNFSICEFSWKTGPMTGTVLAEVSNVKMELLEAEETIIPEIEGEWSFKPYSLGYVRNDTTFAYEFKMNLTAKDDTKKLYDATFNFEGFDEFTLEAKFDGIDLIIPFDSTYLDAENNIRLGIKATKLEHTHVKKGQLSFSYSNSTLMWQGDYIVVRKDSVISEEINGTVVERDTAMTLQQITYGWIEREDPNALDWSGEYTVNVKDIECFNGTVEFPETFTMVVEKSIGSFTVTEFAGYKSDYYPSIELIPGEDGKTATLNLEGSYGFVLLNYFGEVKVGEETYYEYHILTDGNGKSTSLNLTLNEDGTISIDDFMVTHMLYSYFADAIYTPLAMFSGVKAANPVYEWAGQYTLTADVEEMDTVKCASEFNVKIENFNGTYFITQFDGNKVYALNDGGIDIKATGDNTASFESGYYVNGAYPVYITINGVDDAAIEMTMDIKGNITISDFIYKSLDYGTNATTPIAKYTNVVLTKGIQKVKIDGIWYNLNTDTREAKVIYKRDSYDGYRDEYSGSITIPATVTYDGVAYSVTSIGYRAFRDCSSLTAITIPKGVTSIGFRAFDGCSSLERVTINCANVGNWFSGLSSIKEIVLGEGVTSIREDAFNGCSSLERVTINCANVGNWFSGMSSIKEIVLGESVRSIEQGAFSGCSSLESLHIGPNVDSYGNKVFEGCTAIKELTVMGNIMPEIHSEKLTSITLYSPIPLETKEFAAMVYRNAMLNIPEGSLTRYQSADVWENFWYINGFDPKKGKDIYLTINQADNGYVKQYLVAGTVCTFTINAFEGWKIHSVTFNDEDVTAQLTEEGTFTTPALSEDAMLNIAYEEIETPTTVASAQASRIKVQGHQGTLRITGTTEGDDISVYTTDGMLVAQESAEDGETLLTLPTGQVYIVTVADMVVKIGM